MRVALVFLVAPGLTWLDAGELMAASHELGIAHPPWFPLFIMLHKFVAMVVPFGEIAFRGNLASAVLGAGGMTLLTRCAIRFGLRPSAVVCAAMMASLRRFSSSIIRQLRCIQLLLDSVFSSGSGLIGSMKISAVP